MAIQPLINGESLLSHRNKANSNFNELNSGLSNKVDKVSGKGLSTNDYTDKEKSIVASIENCYSIVPSISSGNLTVALKNYLGQDPSSQYPVKIQIGDTVRTITSALSNTTSAGGNWCNAGSSELATKEVDYFTYLWVNNLGNIQIGMSRIPSGLTYSDFSATGSNEKFLTDFIGNTAGTNKVINIGRFSAILSAGPGYTWSTPSAGFQVINHYINETKLLDYYGFYFTDGNTGTVNITYNNKYKIVGNTIYLFIGNTINSISGSTGVARFKTPFNLTNNTVNEIPISGFICKYGENPITQGKGQPVITTSSSIAFLVGVNTGAYTGNVLTNERIRIQGFYQI